MSLFWIVQQQECFNGAILDFLKPPYHPVMQSLSNTWAGLMELNGSEKLLEAFDKYLSKAQVIIARKA
jgi:site-specific DNA-adenine methylase